jgi:hypothetical protein
MFTTTFLTLLTLTFFLLPILPCVYQGCNKKKGRTPSHVAIGQERATYETRRDETRDKQKTEDVVCVERMRVSETSCNI